MTPIFGEEAYRLPVGAGRGTVGTVRALRALSVRSSYIPLYIPYILKYTVGILCVGRASSRAPRPGSWLFISSAVDVNSATPRPDLPSPQ